MSFSWKISGIMAALVLAGCGGGTTDNDSTSVTATTGKSGPDTVVITDAGGGNYDVTVNGVTTRYATSPAVQQTANGFTRFSDGAANVIGYQTATNSTYANVAAAQGAAGYIGASYGRTTSGDIPTTGTASFSGDYVGVVYDPAANTFAAVSDGRVALSANFGTSTITGNITNRDLFDPSNGVDNLVNAGDVNLTGTIGGNGKFSGTTTGGALPGGTASAGTFGGLFGGNDASQVAGALTIPHNVGGTAFTEVGAFTGN